MAKSLLYALLILCASSCLCYVSGSGISEAEFNAAVTKNGFTKPSSEVYKYFSEGTAKYSRNEAAMFLAQILHESMGFRYTEELLCLKSGNNCAEIYKDKVGLPGKSYHGRGYIQLTWGENYKAASQALGMGDRLLQNPEIVANDKRIAMLVSTWFWEKRVRPLLAGKEDQFGRTTLAINGGECKYAKYHQRAMKRWNIYVKVAEALKLQNRAMENGCYN